MKKKRGGLLKIGKNFLMQENFVRRRLFVYDIYNRHTKTSCCICFESHTAGMIWVV